jgi:hypothetical protein
MPRRPHAACWPPSKGFDDRRFRSQTRRAADVRNGSKSVRLAASKTSPLFHQRRTLVVAICTAVSCYLRRLERSRGAAVSFTARRLPRRFRRRPEHRIGVSWFEASLIEASAARQAGMAAMVLGGRGAGNRRARMARTMGVQARQFSSIISNASYTGRSPLSISRYRYRTSLTG